MFTKGDNHHSQKSFLQIKQDDKFFCRLLTKESSMSNSSFRVASTVTVPFVWESQPGTPKHTFSDNTLPPLTPPPSYYLNKKKQPLKNNNNKSSRSNLLFALFPKLNLKKTILASSPSSPSSSSCSSDDSSSLSSSSSKVVVPVRKINGRRRFLSYGSSFDFRGDDEENDVSSSPNSTLCFGISRSTSTGIKR